MKADRTKPFMLNVQPPEGTRPVIGWEGLYQASADGRIWSFPKRGHRGKWLAGKTAKNGYVQVVLTNGEMTKCLNVHRLIATAFIPNPQNKPQVNHLDGHRDNNAVANLEWCTSSENHQHAFDSGLRVRPRKLSFEQECEAVRRRNNGETCRSIAARWGVDPSMISRLTYEEVPA